MCNRKGFTLIELLVVVAIIALLIALLLPQMAKAKDEAKIVKCQANLHAIAIGFSTYNNQNADLMPQSNTYSLSSYPATNNTPPKGYLQIGWAEALTADGCFLQNNNWNGKLDNNGTWSIFAQGIGIFQCPAHSADTQRDSNGNPTDARSSQGYGMAWCAASDFGFTYQPNTYPLDSSTKTVLCAVLARALDARHIIAADANEGMAHFSAFQDPASSQYGVYQRHKRNASWGANYLFADSHVEWSEVYGHEPSPGIAGLHGGFNASVNWNSAVYKGHSRIWAHGLSNP